MAPNETQADAKDALLAAYSSLRDEMIARINTQSTVLGWLMGLSGAFVATLMAAQPADEKTSLLRCILYLPKAEAYSTVFLLCGGYVVAVELLIAYWIYQLFHVFRFAKVVVNMEKVLRKRLGLKDDDKLISWAIDTAGVSDAALPTDSSQPRCVKIAVSIASCLQPLSLYIMATAGIAGFVGMLFAAYRNPTLRHLLVPNLTWLASIVCVLTSSLTALAAVHLSLNKWIIVKNVAPWEGLFPTRKHADTLPYKQSADTAGPPGKRAEAGEAPQAK